MGACPSNSPKRYIGQRKAIYHSLASHITQPSNINFVLFLLWITDATVVVSPSHDYTTFENNASVFIFNCSGNGAFILWTVDGYTTGSSYVRNKGIQDTNFIISPDELTVSSQLIVPTTKANNNITVICIVQNLLLIRQTSEPDKLLLQGTMHWCMYCVHQ